MHCIVLCSPQLCNIVFFLAKSCGIWTTCSGAQVVRCRRWKLNVGHLAGYCFFFTSYFLPLFPRDQHLVMKRTCSSNGAPRNLLQKHNIWISEKNRRIPSKTSKIIEDPHFSASILATSDAIWDPGFPSLTTSDLTSNHPEATWKFVKIHQAQPGRQVPPLEVEVAGFPNPICWLFVDVSPAWVRNRFFGIVQVPSNTNFRMVNSFVFELFLFAKPVDPNFKKKNMMEKKQLLHFCSKRFPSKKKMKFPWVTLFPLFFGHSQKLRCPPWWQKWPFPMHGLSRSFGPQGKCWSWDSNHSLFSGKPAFGDAGLTPQNKGSKGSKSWKRCKETKKNKAPPNVSTSSTKKKKVPSHSVSFPPSHRGNCLTLEKLPTKKVANPKKMHQTKKLTPFFCYPQTSPGWVCRQFLLPLLRAPGTNEFKVIWSAALDSVNSWGGKKPIPVESYDYLLLWAGSLVEKAEP